MMMLLFVMIHSYLSRRILTEDTYIGTLSTMKRNNFADATKTNHDCVPVILFVHVHSMIQKLQRSLGTRLIMCVQVTIKTSDTQSGASFK